MTIDFREVSGAGGVLTARGFKACLPSVPPPLSLAVDVDRIETSSEPYRSLDLHAIEGREGHTLHRHVGLGDDALQGRALRTHHDVSCFDDAFIAQRTVDRAFAENQGRIAQWVGAHGRANLDLHVHFDRTIGRVYRYDSGGFERANDADVILERSAAMPQGYTVVTAYPSAA